jgi:predicted ester cyclase
MLAALVKIRLKPMRPFATPGCFQDGDRRPKLVADSEKVAAHSRSSGTHLGEWMGHQRTGQRFQDVDEIYIVRVSGGKLAGAFG